MADYQGKEQRTKFWITKKEWNSIDKVKVKLLEFGCKVSREKVVRLINC